MKIREFSGNFFKFSNFGKHYSSNGILPEGKHTSNMCFSIPFGFSLVLLDQCDLKRKLLRHQSLEGEISLNLSRSKICYSLLLPATCSVIFGTNDTLRYGHSIRSVRHVCIYQF